METYEIAAGENVGPLATGSAPFAQNAYQRALATADEEALPLGSAGKRPIRLSTQRRIERLKTLLSELAVRDLNHFDVARLFECSLSAARNYMRELRDAAVVILPTAAVGKSKLDEARYQLSPHVWLVQDFIDAKYYGSVLAAGRPQRCASASAPRHFHILADDVKHAVKINNCPARRDPLVAALFGERALGVFAPRP